jgi:TonB family protein
LAAALLACCAAGARAQSGAVRRAPAPSPEGGVAQPQTTPAPTEGAALAAERACADAEAAAAAGRDSEALDAYGRALKLYLGLLDRDRPPVPRPLTAPEAAAFREAMRARMSRVPECAEGYLRLARGAAASERAQAEALRGQALMLREADESRTVFLGPELDARAHIEYKTEPGYTEEARRNRVRGRVRVRAVLASDGTVKHVLVLKGLPHGLSEQAVSAALRTRFTPALKNGHPVSQFVTLEYGFETY